MFNETFNRNGRLKNNDKNGVMTVAVENTSEGISIKTRMEGNFCQQACLVGVVELALDVTGEAGIPLETLIASIIKRAQERQ